MRTRKFHWLGALLLPIILTVQAQQGPFSPEDWPATIDPNKTVHFISVDQALSTPGGWFDDVVQILSGGDQVTEPITIGGHSGLKVIGNYLNVADTFFETWADHPVIDILVQVYGDSAVLNANAQPRNFNFLTGTLPELNAPNGGSLPVEARNQQWNWVLFRIVNGVRPSDGSRFVGSIPANAQGDTRNGGVNGGTIRFEGVPGLIVRAVAFGEEGAFGEPEQINVFATAEECAPEPETNHVFLDINTDTSHHLVVLNDGDQTVTIEENVGPEADKRRAVRANGSYMNFGITDNYLGLPCNEPRTIKIGVEFYDDPFLAGAVFGPEAYATDALGGIGFVPEARRHVLEGTGEWIRRSFTVPAVNLYGVNTAPLTGGPRLVFDLGQVLISKFELAVLRVGDHPLAGQDPLSHYFEDPRICTEEYGNYAELDLHTGLENGLAPGNSGGDQNMIQEEAGPASDRRAAIRPAFDDGAPGFTHQYLNLAIIDEVFGPSSQPNARLAICVTYYDDPDLAGATFRPEVYQTDRAGQLSLAFVPASANVVLEGTDQWREAYFEIPDMKFIGVNQGPQAAARFVFSGKVNFTRVRYAVIRPCGPSAGVNLLEDCKPQDAPALAVARAEEGMIRLTWPAAAAGLRLQTAENLSQPNWQPVAGEPVVEGDLNVWVQEATGTAGFFRLIGD
jgi:hypothetical protein